MTSCIGFLISMFRTRMCGQTLLFIVIANCTIAVKMLSSTASTRDFMGSRRDGNNFCGSPAGMWKRWRNEDTSYCNTAAATNTIRRQLSSNPVTTTAQNNMPASIFGNCQWYTFIKCGFTSAWAVMGIILSRLPWKLAVKTSVVVVDVPLNHGNQFFWW